jgi:D-glycero-beta-D-manno-heptose-7-phosphate kinase
MTAGLASLLPRFRGLQIAVIGDMVADQYIFTEPMRLSREAPVLVVRHQVTRLIPGGAANALNNLHALEARVQPVGIVGDDLEGAALLEDLRARGIPTDGLVTVRGTKTISKTRVLAGDVNRSKQQLLRIDREPEGAPDAAAIAAVRDRIRRILPAVDAVILSDYGYDLVTGEVIAEARAAFRGRVMAADSRYRILDFRGMTVATPNASEAEAAAGVRIRDVPSLEAAGRKLLEALGTKALLITRGNQGMSLFEPGKPRVDIVAAGSEEVTDVSGAGDTVIAVVTLALAAGASFEEAARLSNAAAGVVVMKAGAATCSPAELAAAAAAAAG